MIFLHLSAYLALLKAYAQLSPLFCIYTVVALYLLPVPNSHIVFTIFSCPILGMSRNHPDCCVLILLSTLFTVNPLLIVSLVILSILFTGSIFRSTVFVGFYLLRSNIRLTLTIRNPYTSVSTNTDPYILDLVTFVIYSCQTMIGITFRKLLILY